MTCTVRQGSRRLSRLYYTCTSV